jgi:hypothetical protein
VRIVESLATRRPDALGITTDLPLTGTFHPLGFTLHLATNSPDVIDAATESWRGWSPEHSAAPIHMRVTVSPDGPPASPGAHRKYGHLYSVVSDAHNSATIDFRDRVILIHVSRETASDRDALRWLYVESLAYLTLNQREVVMIHAGLIARNGRGVLLCGSTTAGKSTLSYACARAGWTWLADDCTCLLPDVPGRVALARSTAARFRLDAPQMFPELEVFASRVRPTGKIGIEVQLAELPGIRTARRAEIAAVTFLDRGPGRPSLTAISQEEALDRLLSDLPTYGPEVDPIHERAVRRVTEAPAYRLRYETLQDGIDLLSTL